MESDCRKHFVFKKYTSRPSFGIREISDFEKIVHVKLKPYEKILLINTGMTENILQIIVGSPVKINVLYQKVQKNIILRKVQIELVENPEIVLLIAYSKINVKCVPIKILNKIKKMESGIGMIIESARLETYKKIIEVGYNPRDFKLYREYYILYEKQKMMKIKEIFLLNNLKKCKIH